MNINNRNCTTNSSGNSEDDGSTDGSQGPLSQKASKGGGGSSSGGLSACRLSVFSLLSCLMVLLQEVSSAANGTSDSSNSTASPTTANVTKAGGSGDLSSTGVYIVVAMVVLTMTFLAVVAFYFSKEIRGSEETSEDHEAEKNLVIEEGENEEEGGEDIEMTEHPGRGRVLGAGAPNPEDLLEPDPSRGEGHILGAGVPEEEPDVDRCGRVLGGGVLEPAVVIVTHTGGDNGAGNTDSSD
ncbi:hypothetical protein [Candidatus Ichthyocystis sparus]|nr:hypothetical protein [Candidatus Ichthyocystis sparus]